MVTLYRTNTSDPEAVCYDINDSDNEIVTRVLELLIGDGVEIKSLVVYDETIWVKFIRPNKDDKLFIDNKEECLTLPKPLNGNTWFIFFSPETKSYVCCDEDDLFEYNLSIHNPHV